jgi:tetratricopeptide (TPR) repeat protein
MPPPTTISRRLDLILETTSLRAQDLRSKGVKDVKHANGAEARFVACGRPRVRPYLLHMRTLSRWLAVSVIVGGLSQSTRTQTLDQEWKAAFDSATQLIAGGEFPAAEAVLTHVLELEKGFASNGMRTGLTLNSLGTVYQHLARPAEAESCYRGALAAWEGNPGADGLGLVRILNNLSRLYIEGNRFGDAERLLRRALATRVEASQQSDLEFARTYEYLFIISFTRRNYVEAEANNQEVLKFCQRALGPRHPETAVAWNDRAVLEIATGRYAEAIAHLSGALQVLEETTTRDHPGLVRILANLGWAYTKAQEPERAEPLLHRAIQIAEVSFGPEDIRTAGVLSTYADVLRKLGRKAEARQLQKRLKAIWAKNSSENPMRFAIDASDLRR